MEILWVYINFHAKTKPEKIYNFFLVEFNHLSELSVEFSGKLFYTAVVLILESTGS